MNHKKRIAIYLLLLFGLFLFTMSVPRALHMLTGKIVQKAAKQLERDTEQSLYRVQETKMQTERIERNLPDETEPEGQTDPEETQPATEAGAELLIHIGIDTVSMDGKGFVKKVADGAKVRKGDVLIEADLDAIKAAGHPATTMMILTNADDFSKVEKTAAGTVTTADLAMKIEK